MTDDARKILIGCVIRAARDLRDATRNICDGEDDGPEAHAAWDELDKALTALAGYAAKEIP